MIDDEPLNDARRSLAVAPRRLGRAPVFAVTSGKAGVGKTNVVANLAAALTQRHKRVMAIDAGLGSARLDQFFNVNTVYSLADFFAGSVSLEEVIVATDDGISLLPGASDMDAITHLSDAQKLVFLAALDALTHELDLVLIDTGSGISDVVTYFASAAQEIIVVVTPERSSLAAGYGLIEALACSRREKRFGILANQVTGGAQARRLFDTLSASALRFLNASLDLLGWIPSDGLLAGAAARRQTVTGSMAAAPSARAIDALAERLIASAAVGTKVKGNLQFFLRRMLEDARAGV